MCALLRSTDKRFLPHTITVFNALTDKFGLLAVVIRDVNFTDASNFNFIQTGISAANSFSIVIDYINSDFGGREFIPMEAWSNLDTADQMGEYVTLHANMWLFNGEHSDFTPGTIVPVGKMTPAAFKALGLRLLQTTRCDVSGLEIPHNIQLAG